MKQPRIPAWAAELSEEEWQFIRRFLLQSGSLKGVAKQYGVSYPTVRVRLDRLIEKIRILDDRSPKSPFHRRLQVLVAEGRIDLSTARALQQAHDESRTEE